MNARAHSQKMNRLFILYDGSCPLCVRCRQWMEGKSAYVPLIFLDSNSLEARAQFDGIPWLGQELVVVSDDGRVWAGPAAFLMALWALVDYREWSYRLSGDTLSKVAEPFFKALSSQRRRLASWFLHPACSKGTCRNHGAFAVSPYR